MDRYGLSQQMVIVNTERLIARAGSLSPEDRTREALTLGAAQRSVRAEFVFMMGGEQPEDIGVDDVDDTHEHNTAGEDDLLAGRLANRGRIDLLRAIRSMSRAAAFLGGGALDSALVQERAALESLQRAFSRTRYILRALTERERLDLSRRLTGSLGAARGDSRVAIPGPADATLSALRASLADIAALAGRVVRAADDDASRAASDLSEAAQRLLGIDPASDVLRTSAAHLTRAAELVLARRVGAASAAIDSAAWVTATAARAFLAAPVAPIAPPGLGELEGALIDALPGARRSGGAPR
jgi:hypothetical protein